MNELYLRSNYTIEEPCLISYFIREYDIKQANISILRSIGEISEEEYLKYKSMPKQQREVSIGYMLRGNPELSTKLKDGITEARHLLFESNELSDSDILSIKNDAIFVIGKRPQNTKFDLIEFVEKNLYSSFYKFDHKEFYYNYDAISNSEKIDIKGIKDDQLLLHRDYLLDFLLNIFFLAQNDIHEAVLTIQDFYRNYVTMNVPVGYYRRFDADSYFETKSTLCSKYTFSNFHESMDLSSLDILYNAKNILMELYKILMTVHLGKINSSGY